MAPKADPHRFDDLFAEFGRIELRRMFGGEGIYANDTMFGLVVDDRIYFKTDDATRVAYVAEHCDPFTYMKKGKRTSLSYFAIPERLYDEPEELAAWAGKAFGVAKTKQAGARKSKTRAHAAALGTPKKPPRPSRKN